MPADWRFFEKFHFSLVVDQLEGKLVEGIKNRKTNEVNKGAKRINEKRTHDFLNKCIFLRQKGTYLVRSLFLKDDQTNR